MEINTISLIILKRKQIIHHEIPYCDDPDGDNFGEVEVQFQFPMKKIDNEVVYSQSDGRNQEKLAVFDRDIRVGALEGPQPVPKIVVGGGEDEPNGIGDVLVPPELLLAEPSGTEIDHHSGKADHAEL